jgi:hypothetical protein
MCANSYEPTPSQDWLQIARSLIEGFLPDEGEFQYQKLDREVQIKDKLSQDLTLFYTV